MSRHIGNKAAVNQAIRMHHQSSTIAVQNVMQNQRIQRMRLVQVVREVIEVGPTTADLQRFIDIISRDVDDPGLEYAQVETEIREQTPFAGVLQFLSSSQNRTELVNYLMFLLMVFQTLLSKPVVAPTAEQVEEIAERVVERVIERVDQEAEKPAPTTTTEPDCEKP